MASISLQMTRIVFISQGSLLPPVQQIATEEFEEMGGAGQHGQVRCSHQPPCTR
jgi:hypothetical protein